MSNTVWTVDPTHTQVEFTVRHLISKVRGRFREFDATVTGDIEDLTSASIQATIKAASVDTNVEDRDNHLRSADFFEVDKFPEITFQSKEIVKNGDNQYTVKGDLTIRGVTKEVELDTTVLGVATDPWGNKKAALTAEGKVNRKDFGLEWNAVLETGGFLVGDDVVMSIDAQFAQQAG
ncbi:MAG TPA: YceI family protein [Sphingobacteriaceae bacterium]|nr:YceI family protein [Sphingobacteriaceae bacterium]